MNLLPPNVVRPQRPPSPPPAPPGTPLPAPGGAIRIINVAKPTVCLTLYTAPIPTFPVIPLDANNVWLVPFQCGSPVGATQDYYSRQLFAYSSVTQEIRILATQSCVTLDELPPTTGTFVNQNRCYGQASQKWTYDDATNTLSPVLAPSLCLTLAWQFSDIVLIDARAELRPCTVTTANLTAAQEQQWFLSQSAGGWVRGSVWAGAWVQAGSWACAWVGSAR